VNLNYIGEILLKLNMPKSETGRILNMVGCYIKPPEPEDLKKVNEDTL
jgi:hypothetical protein